MEPHQECAYDHIVVYDGHTTDARALGRFCGSKLPHSVAATGIKYLSKNLLINLFNFFIVLQIIKCYWFSNQMLQFKEEASWQSM